MLTARHEFLNRLESMPIVAILRGIEPFEAVNIGNALLEAGVEIIEVPLNSPRPFDSIAALSDAIGQKALIGAGTVLTPAQVPEVAAAGGRLIVSPNTDAAVIQTARNEGMAVIPGFTTPSEALAAIYAGADALKLFPAENCPPKVLKAMLAVLPLGTPVLAVGGISVNNMQEYWTAGARGFGIGSSLYQPGNEPDDILTSASTFASKAKGLAN